MQLIDIGVVGLGRLGTPHAQNLVYKTADVNVTSVCNIAPEEARECHSLHPKQTHAASVMQDATENTRTAIALTGSYRKGQVVNITDY